MALPFSPFIEKNGFIFTSGQIYLNPEGKLLEGTIQEQTKQVMYNLEKVLTSAGVSLKDVVKTTIYITDMTLYSDVSTTYGTYFTGNFPAREMVCVKELPLEAKVEISMVAVKPK